MLRARFFFLFCITHFVSGQHQNIFFCEKENTITESNYRILVLSPDDEYFFKTIGLQNANGKLVPESNEKTFNDLITINGFLVK